MTGYSPLTLGNQVTLSIEKGNELVTIEYSPYAYAARKWGNTTEPGIDNLVKAMVTFGDAVKTYFDNRV